MTKPAKLIGQVLDGKYQLDKQLGQGGMGAVYLATHLGTKRPVALKVIAPQFMANTEFVERFRREAEAAGRLRHPNVVNVTDFGFAQVGRDPVAYLVMEYLDGGSLGDMLKERGRLPLPLVTDILEQICLAVGNAHKLGVIHRDLKPDNIWLQPDGRGGYIAKVLDFGLAKLRDPGELHLGEGAGAPDATMRGQGAQTVKAGARTSAGQVERTNVQGDVQGAVTAIAAEEQTALLNQPHTTVNDGEGATRIQPPRAASGVEDEGATLLQSLPAEAAAGDEGATLIQANAAGDTQVNEAATLVQPAPADDGGATLVQPSTAGNDQAYAPAESAVRRDSRPSLMASSRPSSVSPPTSAGARSASSDNSLNNSLSGDTSAVDLTRVGSIMGTPLYMSPEQCRSEALDARSDIYSLGVIVYQSLAGEAPFKGDMTELMRKHVDDAPPPLGDKRPDIPAAVNDLVLTSLAKRAADRPPSAEAFALAFRATAEGETQILRAAKTHYYMAQRVFFLLSLVVYAPFALLSLTASITLNPLLAKSPAATLIFYIVLYLLVLLATRISVAACTAATAELRLKSSAAVKLKQIVRAMGGRLPALLATSLQSLARVLFGLLKLIVPGARVYVDHALAPSVVILEETGGAAALARSRRLIGPLRLITAALMARDFGLSLSSLLLFPFITVLMALIFGGTRADALATMMVPTLRNVIVIYCWFLLTIMHTVYSAVPIATLYFKARQASGELLDERGTRDWQAEAIKRPGRMSRAAVIWLMIPIVMLALMVLSSFWSGGFGEDSLIEAARKGRRQTVAQKLAAGANPNDSRLSTSVLMYAAKDGHAEIVRDLLNAGARLDARDNDGDTALMYAAIDDRVDVVKALLAAGADVNAQNNKGDSPLMAAALRGRAEVVKSLLAGGADAGLRNQKGQTALSVAEAEGHAEIVQLLKGASAARVGND
ncbi:MAG TPA: ankyrin repeat domain-containing protein [Blastocatellia bacterium]|nr:ankyrin repeat domain-containing protein [Blastocatellia bacterium]